MGTKQTLRGLCALLALAGLVACGRRPVAPRLVGPKDGASRVLIATRNTPFKNQVVSRIVESLAPLNATVQIMDAKDLPGVSAVPFQVIVILDDYRWWSLSGPVKQFVEKLDETALKKVVLVGTAGSPAKMRKLPGVDASTCASTKVEIGRVTQRLLKKVRERLAPHPRPTRAPAAVPPAGKGR